MKPFAKSPEGKGRELSLPGPTGLPAGGPFDREPAQPVMFLFQSQLVSFEALMRTKLAAKIKAPNEAELAAALEASLHDGAAIELR